MVVPGHRLDLAVSLAPRRLRSVGVAGDDHQTKRLKSVGDDGSLRRTNDVVLLRHDENDDTDAEHQEAHQVCSPESLVFLHEWCREQRQATNVDAGVKHHVDPLEGDGGVDNDTLASLGDGGESHLLASVLVGDERRNVGFNTTGTETNDDDSRNVATEGSAMLDSHGERGCPQDHQSNPVDRGECQNRVVLSEVLISYNGTQDWCDIAEELEEDVETSCTGMAETKTARSVTSIGVVVDVILEETLASVVYKGVSESISRQSCNGRHTGETLAQLDHRNQVG